MKLNFIIMFFVEKLFIFFCPQRITKHHPYDSTWKKLKKPFNLLLLLILMKFMIKWDPSLETCVALHALYFSTIFGFNLNA